MTFLLPQRKSPRLKGYDYSRNGAYFVTICTWKRLPVFGAIRDGEMHLNPIGKAAAACWLAMPDHFPQVELDAWVIMPNHMHGILVINPADAQVARPYNAVDRGMKQVARPRRLGVMINSYKGAVTRAVRSKIE